MSLDATRPQRFFDALQVIAPLAQRLDVTARQQQQDAAALFEATERAVTLVREMRPDARAEGGER